jgi:hypothetical protein
MTYTLTCLNVRKSHDSVASSFLRVFPNLAVCLIHFASRISDLDINLDAFSSNNAETGMDKVSGDKCRCWCFKYG